jgi:transglutaminase-like putative cysteine protease
MSALRVALGLAGIALGVRQISGGFKHLKSAGGPQKTAAKRRQRPLGDVSVDTPSGKIRLRTYDIRNLDERIEHLRRLAYAGKKDPAVYEFARRAVNAKCGDSWCVPEKDNLAEARALFNAVRKNVRYTSDIAGIDSYQKPGHTLVLRTGDCDDYSTLACAAAASLGMPCRFKVIRTKGAPMWNHIYAQIGFPRRNPRKWVSFDASVSMPFGWEPPVSMVADARVFPL